jgi:hypothetical protein
VTLPDLGSGAIAQVQLENEKAPSSSGTSEFLVSSSPSGGVSSDLAKSPKIKVGSTGSNGQGTVLKGLPIPNPQKGGTLNFAVELDGPATQIQAQIYGRDFTLLGETVFQGAWNGGWVNLSWPNWDLSNGVYYVTLAVKGSPSKAIAKLVVVH